MAFVYGGRRFLDRRKSVRGDLNNRVNSDGPLAFVADSLIGVRFRDIFVTGDTVR